MGTARQRGIEHIVDELGTRVQRSLMGSTYKAISLVLETRCTVGVSNSPLL
jgi:hypothetical protein